MVFKAVVLQIRVNLRFEFQISEDIVLDIEVALNQKILVRKGMLKIATKIVTILPWKVIYRPSILIMTAWYTNM